MVVISYQFGYWSGLAYSKNKQNTTDNVNNAMASISHVIMSGIYEYSEDHRCRLVNYSRLPKDNFPCVRLKVKDEPYICVYNMSKEDRYVSYRILTNGTWENDYVKMIVNRLNDDPELAFIDIGANIGQFALVAASMGRKVIAVEALKRHALMIGRAVVMNGYQNRVKIVHNALSDTYRNVTLATFPGNPGRTKIRTGKVNAAIPASEQIPTILMDDLVNLVDFRRAIMKIDIEGQEVPALSHSLQLFTKVDIPFIIMEWWGAYRLYTTDEQRAMVTLLISFFKNNGYSVYSRYSKKLNINKSREWPFEIIWRKDVWTQRVKAFLYVPCIGE